MNNIGDWIAIGCENQGQLMVWEWQSQTYVLKQQAHASGISCLTYSNDGSFIATGGVDAKVRINQSLNEISISSFNRIGPIFFSDKGMERRKRFLFRHIFRSFIRYF